MRVAGNIVNTDLVASLEYDVHYLRVPFVMMVGHTGCGAIDAALKVLKTKVLLPGHLPELVTALKPSVIVAEKGQSGNLLDNVCIENGQRQVTQSKNSPPVVEQRYTGKQIDIVGGMYDLGTGQIGLI